MERRPRGREASRPQPELNEEKDWLAQALADSGRPGHRNMPEIAVQRSLDALTKAMVGVGVELRKINSNLEAIDANIDKVQHWMAP